MTEDYIKQLSESKKCPSTPFLIVVDALWILGVCFIFDRFVDNNIQWLFLLAALLLIPASILQGVVFLTLRKRKTRRPSLRMLYLTPAVLVTLAVLYLLAGFPLPGPWGENRKAVSQSQGWTVVDTLARMQSRPYPLHLILFRNPGRWGTDFDVNRYFLVLDRLSMEPGYRLDYVYYATKISGAPMLYARKLTDRPYHTWAAYQSAFGEKKALDRRDEYLQHVQSDGSKESFIQLVVLHIMANQFYLWWHANYNDERIISDHDRLDVLLGKKDIFKRPSDEDRQKASALDLKPRSELQGEAACVSLYTWSNWSGLSRKTYTINRRFPHRILKQEGEMILPFYCGILF